MSGYTEKMITRRRRNIPFRVAFVFLFFSSLWILFSDRIVLLLIDDVEMMTIVQTVKGWVYIFLTTIIIFNLLKREISKVKKMENQLIRNEKMISISHMAAGMANRINNPLAGIVQNAQLIRSRMTADKKANREAADELNLDFDLIAAYMDKREIDRILDSIIVSGREASELIEDMLTFSASERREKENCDIAALLDRTLEIFQRDGRLRNCEIRRDYGRPSFLFCDPAGIQHVLYHILNNALDSTENLPGERTISLSISTGVREMDIAIEDTGPGIGEKNMGRIFDPFFTTKEGSMGLGLAISTYIVSEIHKGRLTVENRIPEGCRVTVSLPLRS